jgi:hypothetical protein
VASNLSTRPSCSLAYICKCLRIQLAAFPIYVADCKCRPARIGVSVRPSFQLPTSPASLAKPNSPTRYRPGHASPKDSIARRRIACAGEITPKSRDSDQVTRNRLYLGTPALPYFSRIPHLSGMSISGYIRVLFRSIAIIVLFMVLGRNWHTNRSSTAIRPLNVAGVSR